MNDNRAYPLHWPEGWPRTPQGRRTRSRFKTTLGVACDDRYRSKILESHPDKPGGSVEATRELNLAIEAARRALG